MAHKKVGNYQLENKISQINGVNLYRAKHVNDINSEEEFFYIVKEYCSEMIEKGALEREKRISNEIENYATGSIIIPILEVIEEEEKEYVVMQFRKNGMFLKEWIERMETTYGKGKIPMEFSLKVVEEILKSLKELHSFRKKGKEIGYLHLDLRPENIFLESVDSEKTKVENVKFINFLSALKIEDGELEAIENKITIVSNYSAPEQLAGEFYKYRLSTDLFSVGVIFLHMLLGTVELSRDNGLKKEAEKQILHSSKRFIMNYTTVRFIKNCIEKNPKYRYQNAEKMQDVVVENLEKCYEAYAEEDYYTLFSIAYKMIIPKNKLEMLQGELNIGSFCNAIEHLEEDLNKNNINYSKCRYLFEVLWNCLEHQSNPIPVKIKFNLLNSGLACYNHTGDNRRTEEVYKEIKKIWDDIPWISLGESLNRIAVMHADRYEFEEAYETISKNICSLEAKKNETVSEEESKRISILAKAYSAKGAYMVWMKRENPMSAFEQALQKFGDDVGNKMITISHILQYAIEIKDKQLYEKYVSEIVKLDVNHEYFHEYKNVKEGLSQILKNSYESENFSWLVFLKGIYTFYIEDVTEECQKQLVQLLQDERLRKLGEHPAQLIYKYIGLILYESKGDLELVEDVLFESMTCIEIGKIDLQNPLNIMMCMTYQTRWIYNEVTGQAKENEELLERMKEHCKISGWNKLYEALEEQGSIKEVLQYEHQ